MNRPTIRLKIDVTKIAKDALFNGKKGIYLDVALFANATGRDEYGQDGFATQEVSKEQREAGKKGAIVGNWRYLDAPKAAPAKPSATTKPHRPAAALDEGSGIPF